MTNPTSNELLGENKEITTESQAIADNTQLHPTNGITNGLNGLDQSFNKKLEIINQLKTNPLVIFKLKDDFFKAVDTYLKSLLKSINDEKSDEGFEENTYKHLYSIATNEYFEKLGEIVCSSQYFFDQLFFYYFVKIKSQEKDYSRHNKIVVLYTKVFSYCKTDETKNSIVEDDNIFSSFTEEFLSAQTTEIEFEKLLNESDFYKKLRYIIHNILKRILFDESANCYKNNIDDILYELYNIFKIDKICIGKYLKSNPLEFIHIHKKLNYSLIGINKEKLFEKLRIIDDGELIIKINNKIEEFGFMNKNGARNFFADIYKFLKPYKDLGIIDSDLKNKLFDYIISEIILKFYKKDLAIISVDLKDISFNEKVISYIDWSKHSTYFNLNMINEQDSQNILRLKDTIISILKHQLSHLIYPVLIYKLRKSIKISFKEFLYFEHLTNIVFSENYEEYKIMFRFNKDLKNLLFNNKNKTFFHLSKWFSWILLTIISLLAMSYIFGFPVYFIALVFVYLYIYYKDEFYVELNLSGIRYYLGILIAVVFVLNGGLSTNKYEDGIKNTYTHLNKINGDDIFYKGVIKSKDIVVEGTNNIADILGK